MWRCLFVVSCLYIVCFLFFTVCFFCFFLFYCDGVCVGLIRSFCFRFFCSCGLSWIEICTAALTLVYSLMVLLCVVCSFVFVHVFVCQGLCFDLVFVL